MSDVQTAAAPAFKKPRRNPNMRKRSVDGDTDEADDQRGGAKVAVVRELQRQRQRTKGVSLDPTGGEEVEEAEEAAEDHGLDSTFTTQTDTGEVDPNMLKYIEAQMRQEEGGAEQGGPALTADPDGLFETPAHLKGRVDAAAGSQLEDANRWLAGIMEVPLGAEDKMATVEATERAKREEMQRKAAPAAPGLRQHEVVVPSNYNANFHQHRRETAVLRKKAASSSGHDHVPPAEGEGIPAQATDHAALERFKRNDRDKQR